ncbi:hypothetical protein LCGC14_2722740 [marine sediment metagenome]|uniref:Uncharacterized protein n=1 Tax=marine sediment metagenome TaxID=412755 RepID=A0A0F8Z9R7_9ZZZZ|nr:hypothetical protein [Candidatus Aminicenantes bacterium]
MKGWILANIMSLLNLLALIAISIFGRNWVNKKNEEIKSLYSKEQFIHKLQFEKEFKIYLNLWEKLISLKNSAELVTLHDALKTKGEHKKEIEGQIIIKLIDDINNVKRTTENNRPFYDEEIYNNALKIIESTKTFVGRSEDLGKEKIEHLLKLVKSESQIYKIIDSIEKAIRKRIRNIGEAKLIG